MRADLALDSLTTGGKPAKVGKRAATKAKKKINRVEESPVRHGKTDHGC